jgi:predicted adenine nucleotide alpha hydrolase (AANH) superfamily ATPase
MGEVMNIHELAKQAGLHIATDVNWMPIISLEYAEKFAALVEAAARADERGRMCKQCKECLNEKSTSNEANRPAFLGEGGQAN